MTTLHLFTPLFSSSCRTLHLFSGACHVDYILNAVVKEVPGVLEVRRRVLKHYKLCGVVDARQCRSFGIPVHLQ